MRYKKKDGAIAAIFNDGDDPIRELNRIAEESGSNLSIISAVGMIENPELGFFNGKSYERKIFRGCFELLAYSGTIVKGDEEYAAHIHAMIGDNEHNVYGGHLFSGKVKLMHEIVLEILPMEFTKTKSDSQTGLMLWDL